MLSSRLDHLVITAPSLAAGLRYVREALGVPLETGGKHPAMGTHNALLKLGTRQYLEVIATDPEAPRPARPRWFELDRTTPATAPRLAGWVARTDDIEDASIATSQTLGIPSAMNRGSLDWMITIPEDGGLPFAGVAPMLIQWAPGPHPADRLPERGCSLIQFEGFHPQAGRVEALLRAIGLQDGFVVSREEAPRLVAHIQTPGGIRLLSSLGGPHGQADLHPEP